MSTEKLGPCRSRMYDRRFDSIVIVELAAQ